MGTRYGIRVAGSFWLGYDGRLARNPIAARWFESATAANLAALREMGGRGWTVLPISLEGDH